MAVEAAAMVAARAAGVPAAELFDHGEGALGQAYLLMERLDGETIEPRPALEIGLRWLAEHRPPPAADALVHGDFRIGNLMVGCCWSIFWTFNMPTDHARVSFDGVRVPDSAIFGLQGRGLEVVQHFFNENRIRQAASSLGAAQFCINRSVEYAKTRAPFGQPLEHIYRHHRRYRITEGAEEIQMRRVAGYMFGYIEQHAVLNTRSGETPRASLASRP